jgi:hypothetical protein
MLRSHSAFALLKLVFRFSLVVLQVCKNIPHTIALFLPSLNHQEVLVKKASFYLYRVIDI